MSSTEKHIALPMLINSNKVMKKYIFVLNAIELLKQIAVGRRISGVLYIDENTGCLTFKAYNRKPRLREKLIGLLDFGRVTESKERIKVYESFPKVLGTARITGILDRDIRTAKDALITREIIERT